MWNLKLIYTAFFWGGTGSHSSPVSTTRTTYLPLDTVQQCSCKLYLWKTLLLLLLLLLVVWLVVTIQQQQQYSVARTCMRVESDVAFNNPYPLSFRSSVVSTSSVLNKKPGVISFCHFFYTRTLALRSSAERSSIVVQQEVGPSRSVTERSGPDSLLRSLSPWWAAAVQIADDRWLTWSAHFLYRFNM